MAWNKHFPLVYAFPPIQLWCEAVLMFSNNIIMQSQHYKLKQGQIRILLNYHQRHIHTVIWDIFYNSFHTKIELFTTVSMLFLTQITWNKLLHSGPMFAFSRLSSASQVDEINERMFYFYEVLQSLKIISATFYHGSHCASAQVI